MHMLFNNVLASICMWYTERSLDLDTVPKTEKLDNQVVSTRPKMPHNPPSRSHIVSNCNYSVIFCSIAYRMLMLIVTICVMVQYTHVRNYIWMVTKR